MAAKGAIAKEEVMNKILAAFPGAFKYEKELRIPMMENGEPLQIKVTLTAAKNMVEAGGDIAMPGVALSTKTPTYTHPEDVQGGFPSLVEPTEEEKKNVANLLDMLGM